MCIPADRLSADGIAGVFRYRRDASGVLAPLTGTHPGESGVVPLARGTDAFVARLVLAVAAERSLDVRSPTASSSNRARRRLNG